MKLIDIIRTASGNMVQSKLRTFLTVIAIFIGSLTLMLTNGIGSGISRYIDKQLGNVGAKDVLIVTVLQDQNGPTNGSAPKEYNVDRQNANTGIPGFAVPVLNPKDVEKIQSFSEIKSVDIFQSIEPDYIQGLSDKKYKIATSSYIEGTQLDMAAGDIPKNDSDQPQIALPVNFVAALGFENSVQAVGKTVVFGVTNSRGELQEMSAEISGVQQKSLIAAGAANINKKLADQLITFQNQGLPQIKTEQYVGVTAHFDNNLTEAQVSDLKNKLKDSGYLAQTIEDRIGIIKQVIRGIIIVFNLFGLIALLAASFGVINTLLMAVQERTKEIGLMKSMGMSGNRIFLLFSAEAILLGFWGSLLGVLAAMGIGKLLNQVASTTFLKDFDGLQLLAFPLQSIVTIMGLIMLIAFLAGTLPARRAAKLNPIDALRYE